MAKAVTRWEDEDFVGQVSPAAVTELGDGDGPLVAIVDFNELQQTGWAGTDPTRREAPWEFEALAGHWAAAGWAVHETDGQREIILSTRNGQAIRFRLNRPQMHSLSADERTDGTGWTIVPTPMIITM